MLFPEYIILMTLRPMTQASFHLPVSSSHSPGTDPLVVYMSHPPFEHGSSSWVMRPNYLALLESSAQSASSIDTSCGLHLTKIKPSMSPPTKSATAINHSISLALVYFNPSHSSSPMVSHRPRFHHRSAYSYYPAFTYKPMVTVNASIRK